MKINKQYVVLCKRFRKQKNSLAIVLAVWLQACQIFCGVPLTVCAAEYTESSAAVREIDLGDYQSQMTVGEKQLLSVTILPEEAAGQEITYVSGNPQIATINGMGRISAVGSGETVITVTCGGISEKFTLTVVNAETPVVRDLDLGDCPTEIEAGSSQLLSVTIIPEEAASSQKLTYQSDDTRIATVNEIGRVTGVAKGKVTITIRCGEVQKELRLKVTEPKSSEVPVKDIEIGDHEDELEVKKTLTLSVTVLPSDATNNTVTYRSSNDKIATVNSSGEVKGIAEGDVTITVSAGTVTKKVRLKVKTATARIELNTSYLVMQLGESYVLKATVFPAEADQKIEFESASPDIISVSGGGVVTAKQCGTGTVLVKNRDTNTAVTVIVNEGKPDESPVQEEPTTEQQPEGYASAVTSVDYPVISSDMLRFFYDSGTVLTVYGTHYTLRVDGRQIRNFNNLLYTQMDLQEEKQGISFNLNQGQKLCGTVTLQFDDDTLERKYVYLYNPVKQQYEFLKATDGTGLELDTAGSYLLTEQKLSNSKIKRVVILTAGVILVALAGVYIGIKKRYWFW